MAEAANVDGRPTWRDYLELCKPNVVALMLLTSLIGMLLAVPGWVPLDVLILGNLGIAACACSAAAVNHLVDRKIDLLMARTYNRPVAKGRISLQNAAVFAFMLACAGFLLLYFAINPLTAWLTLSASVGYAFIYTLWLKRASPQNIVVGGLAGAAPPLLGWTAVTGEIHGHALLLVLIIFAWTPPHFWALAIHRKKEYANAEIPMLPVTHGEAYAKLHTVLYTFILLVVSVLPFVTGMLGSIYLFSALVLGAAYLYYVGRLWLGKNPKSGMDAFWYSIVYLMALFAAMLVDHYVVS
jgi:protoheme IX farnesyltransferase